MKKLMKWGGVFAASLCVSAAAFAATTASIPATAKVTGVSTLTAQLKNNLATPTDAASMDFGTHASSEIKWDPAGTGIPAYFISISVVNNGIAWRLRLTTKNIDASTAAKVAIATTTWGFSYGGMISTTSAGGIIPFGWRCTTGAVVADGAEPAGGDPGASVGWMFVKDQADQNDPTTASSNESFAWVDANTGYCNIAFGGPTSANVVALKPGYSTASPLPTQSTPFKLFIQGNFNGAPAAGYGSAAANATWTTLATQNNIVLDLLQM